MKFKSKKDILFNFIIYGTTAFLITMSFSYYMDNGFNTEMNWMYIINLLLISFLFWIFYGTKYELTDTTINYVSGPIRGKIKIDKIKEIVVGKTMWIGLKPATASKGLIVKYNKFEEIYITPFSNEKFIIELLKRNNTIKITR